MHDETVPDEVAQQLQEGLDALNEQDPARYHPMPVGANFRHMCEKARQAKHTGKGVSTAIDLKERYVTGWETTDGNVVPAENADTAEYAILYREGRCKSCKELARSKEGRIVRTADRPPVLGRVGRE